MKDEEGKKREGPFTFSKYKSDLSIKASINYSYNIIRDTSKPRREIQNQEEEEEEEREPFLLVSTRPIWFLLEMMKL